MRYVIYGAVGVVVVLLLVFAGAVLGWRLNNLFRRHKERVTAEELGEEERRRLIEEQTAFESLLNYNMDTAYGMTNVPLGDDRGDT